MVLNFSDQNWTHLVGVAMVSVYNSGAKKKEILIFDILELCFTQPQLDMHCPGQLKLGLVGLDF